MRFQFPSYRALTCGLSIISITWILQGCSEHAERDVPKARGRKTGEVLTSCDIYLGLTAPFTIATYEATGDGQFHLTSATCGAKKTSAHVSGSPAGERPAYATDCEELQDAERDQYAEGKDLSSLYEECDGPGRVETSDEEGMMVGSGSLGTDDTAKLKEGLMSYRTVSIFVKDIDDSNTGSYYVSGGSHSSSYVSSFVDLGESHQEIRKHD
ncbi:hypothetical protein FOL47_010669 [Perkinsus chesapeaki]|uniref:Secreted protein n=1 Tax=Perkinsus chesapeaki TaxID=330153 RepID=A0A7J6L2Q6_PERCH|nr:hypothetical protein FOL47_010669 [Perkinsus chesapeaki]